MRVSHLLELAALGVAAFCSCKCAPAAPAAQSPGNAMKPTYTLVPAAAGASRLYLGPGSTSLVAEHRHWLDEAYRARATEAPGVLQLIRPDGSIARTVSGWAIGGPLGNDMAWVEEAGEEYRYRIASTGGGSTPLAPPGDFWVVAAAVGHVASPLGAVVLWRPAAGALDREPALRHDELWIATIDRKAGTVVKDRQLALTLPEEREAGVALGGSISDPILLLTGLPDAGGPGAYRLLGLHLATLETAWESPLDMTAATAAQVAALPPPPSDRASMPLPPPPPISGDSLRTLSRSMTVSLGDGSGWLIMDGHSHGLGAGRVFSADLSFLIGIDGKLTWLRDVHLSSTAYVTPILGQPAVIQTSVSGARNSEHFASVDAIWASGDRVETLFDDRSKIQGRALGEAPELLPLSVAADASVMHVAPPIGGKGLGADSDDVRGKQTTPTAWHQSDRPRVIARQQWLEQRARK